MKILAVEDPPFDTLRYHDAHRGGGHPMCVERDLHIHLARVDALPDGLDALVVTSDLQGRELPKDGPPRLLGEVLAEHLEALGQLEMLPPAASTGVILAGDLYTVPGADRMGGTGDVRVVWQAFADRFRWVAGVAGNHDMFGPGNRDQRSFARRPGIHLLDGEVRDLDGLRVGGVGGVIGNPEKNQRKPAEELVGAIERLFVRSDLLVLHEGPDLPAERYVGSPLVRETLEALDEGARGERRPIVVCGHSAWPVPLASLGGGLQVLKVDARVVVLLRR